MKTVGWIGSWCLALCGLPQAIACLKNRCAAGLSGTFLTMWAVGEVCTMAFIWERRSDLGPLVLNYGLNLAFLSIIIYFKVKDEYKTKKES